MTREDILKMAKPILFNTEDVRATLDNRKTVKRLAIKVNFREGEAGYYIIRNSYTWEFCYLEVYDEWESEVRRIGYPYKLGDYLYVLETWNQLPFFKEYIYKADDPVILPKDSVKIKWRPSIHMPKEAARIFLRVTDVKVERLRDITEEGAKAEGANFHNGKNVGVEEKMRRTAIERFAEIWDSAITPKDRDKYGWDANPYVWKIEFERVEIEKGE